MKLRPGLCLPAKYVEQPRESFKQYSDFASDGLWQQAAYDHAVRRCKELGLRSIADFGCGSAVKMMPLMRRFDVTLVDLSSTIEPLRHMEHKATLVEHDFEHPDELRMPSHPQAVFCMDVIEHLRDPSHLLAEIRRYLQISAARAFISSPCRLHGVGFAKLGPPANRGHIREWTCKEFDELLRDARFEVIEATHHREHPTQPDVGDKGTMLFEVVDGA